MKIKALILSALASFALTACGGVSSCDTEDIASQALNIATEDLGYSADKLGAYVSDIVMNDKEANVCQAKINLKVIDEFNKEIESEPVKSKIEKAGFGVMALPERLLAAAALKVMGQDVKIDYDKMSVIKADGSDPLKDASLQTLGEFQSLMSKIGKIVGTTLVYKVVDNGKGDEYIHTQIVSQ